MPLMPASRRLLQYFIETNDGAIYDSGELCPKWGPDKPEPTDQELSQKFDEVAEGIIPASRAHEIEDALNQLHFIPKSQFYGSMETPR